jgi:UMF1 family MFS transporter
MQFFTYVGSAACCSMFFFTKNNISFGIIASVVASIGYCGSIVFYNAYLPEIAAEDDQDWISAKGFTMGYIGSVLLMIVCLAAIMMNDKMNLGWGAYPARLSFLAVGIWWAGFAQITFNRLPPSKIPQQHAEYNIFTNGFHELKKVWYQLKDHPNLSKFLRGFFFYNMGVQTVMYLATYFASDELKMESSELIITVLIIQIVAILGATLFSKLSDKTNNILTLCTLICIWILICYFASIVTTITQFYMIAFCVGMVMGGIQSMSRSTYSKLLPDTKDTASFFSFYDVCDKMGTVIGTLSFGYVSEYLGGMRNSVLALMVFFIVGLVLLLFVKMKRNPSIA